MVRKILKYPDPVLRKKSEPVDSVDEEVKALLTDLVDTMRSVGGVGLAAPQIGVNRRVIVIEIPEDETEDGKPRLIKLVNPEVVDTRGTVKFEEGCLSIPGIRTYVKRNEEVVVKGLDEEGKETRIEATGLLAIALQHEIDHLDGVLFIDRVSSLKREFLLKRYRKQMLAKEQAL